MLYEPESGKVNPTVLTKTASKKTSKKSCRFCGSPMPVEAVRCNACELRQDWIKPCINCGALLPESAGYCPNCESYQLHSRECVACGVFIPHRAKVCPKCGSVQAFGGLLNVSQITLSLTIALLTVLGIVVPALKTALTPNQSQTHFELIEMNKDFQLVLLASNAGNRSSYLRRVSIEFPKFPQANRDLDILGETEERVFKPGGQKILRLEVSGFPLSKLGIKDKNDPMFRAKLLGGGQVLKAEIVGIGEKRGMKEVEAMPGILRKFVERRAG